MLTLDTFLFGEMDIRGKGKTAKREKEKRENEKTVKGTNIVLNLCNLRNLRIEETENVELEQENSEVDCIGRAAVLPAARGWVPRFGSYSGE